MARLSARSSAAAPTILLLLLQSLWGAHGLVVEDPCCSTWVHLPAAFGPRFSGADGVRGELLDTRQLVGHGGDVFLCHGATEASLSGKIAFVPRGNCMFFDKVMKAQASGATGVVVYNPEPPLDGNALVHMSTDSAEVGAAAQIPSVFISFQSAVAIANMLDSDGAPVLVHINGTEEYDAELLDPLPVLMQSVLFMVQLVLSIWAIVGLFFLFNWCKARVARRRRLDMVRKLPTRQYRAAADSRVGIAAGGSGGVVAAAAATASLPSDARDSDDEEGEGSARVHPATGVQELELAIADAPRHPRRPGHHRVPLSDDLEDVDVNLARADAGSGAASTASAALVPVAGAPAERGITDYFACESCVVCICDFENGEWLTMLPCGHGYHKDCIEPWLIHKSALCPICKQSILPSGDARSLDEIAAADEADARPNASSDTVARAASMVLAGVIIVAGFSSLVYMMTADV